MSPRKRLVCLYALSQIRGLGPVKVKALISRFGTQNLSRIFEFDVESLMGAKGVIRELALSIKRQAERVEDSDVFISKQLEVADRLGARLVPITDESYPKLLKNSSPSPEILYALGNFRTLDKLDRACIAIAGTRRSTADGEKYAYNLGREFGLQKWVIISGLARGIDAAAHRGCLDANEYTVAVVGSGCDVVYPKETSLERNRILEHGLILSEYPFGTRPSPVNLKKRNKIIVGLSEGLIIAQTGVKGGAHNAVQAAKEQRKPVFAVTPESDKEQFDGNFELVKTRRAIPIPPSMRGRRVIEMIKREQISSF